MLKSLKGLEYAENLEWLSLVNQQESSLEPLKNCKKLKHLDMRNNDKITDISPLSNLVNLEELDMRSVKCGNIEALSNCKKLRSLTAFSCGIKDLKPLENLLNLEYLEIEFNEFEDVSALKNLTNLKYLDISKLGMKYDIFGNKNPTVKSIAALEKLVNLEFLSISSNDIKDLTPLKNMRNLTYLGASNNLIDDWNPIYNLGNKLLTVHSQGNDSEYDSSKIVAKAEDGKSDQIFDLLEVVNPEKIKVINKNEALSKLPKKVSVKIRKHDDSKPVYTEGIYNKATIRYIVKDEDGKIVSTPLSFSANTIDSKEYGYINSISNDGYVDFVANGIAKEMKVDLNSNDYELVGNYKFKENTCTEGYHIDWVEKNGKIVKIDPLKPKNGTTFNIPEDKKDVFVLVVKKSAKPVENPNPDIDLEKPKPSIPNNSDEEPSEGDTSKEIEANGFVEKRKINYVIKDLKGNIIKKDDLKFTANQKNSGGYNKSFFSKNGHVEFTPLGTDGENTIELNDDEYELIDYNAYKEKYSSSDMTSIINGLEYGKDIYDNKKIAIDSFGEDGRATVDKEAVTLVLKKKGETDTGERSSSLQSLDILNPMLKKSIKVVETGERGFAKRKQIDFLIKDTEGNIVREPLKFHTETETSENNLPARSSKDGHLQYNLDGTTRNMKVVLDSDEYEMVSRNAYSENYDSAGYITSIGFGKDLSDTSYKKYTLEKPKDGETEYRLPEDNYEILTITVKKKSSKVEEEKPVSDGTCPDGTCPIGGNKDDGTPSEDTKPSDPVSEGTCPDGTCPISGNKDKEKNDEKTVDVDVEWTLNNQKSKDNSLVFDGKLKLPENISNPNELSVRLIAEIEDKKDGSSLPSSSVSSSSSSKYIEKKDDSIEHIENIAGENREKTSVELSRKHYSKTDTVILVNGYNYADALVSSSLSSTLNAPILLVKSNSVSKEVENEIERLGATKLIVIGGENSVSSSSISSLNVKDIERVHGKDRYETANKVYDKLKDMGKVSKSAIIASGEGFADALSAATIAGTDSTPILLTKSSSISESTERRAKGMDLVVVGGNKSVDDSVVKKLGNNINRLSGKDRYETSKLVAQYRYPFSNKAIIASGEGFADALSIGGITGKEKSPIILIKKNETPKEVREYLRKLKKFEVVGGNSTIDRSQFKKK
nr:cell wall-binding repeat-containing protein [uncultured Peptostreptococcus sp.]